MNTPNEPTISTQVIARAMKDAAFRQALLADPRGVLERETGVKLPAGVEIQVVEETASVRYLVLPPMPQVSDELSDAELETIAGGLASSSDGGIGAGYCRTGNPVNCD